MKKKGQLSIMFAWIVIALLLVLISAVLAPMGVLFNEKMYEAGESILYDANDSLENIQDVNVKNSISLAIGEGISATQTNIEVNTDIFQYGWVIIVLLSGLVAFLITRSLVEVRGGGFV